MKDTSTVIAEEPGEFNLSCASANLIPFIADSSKLFILKGSPTGRLKRLSGLNLLVTIMASFGLADIQGLKMGRAVSAALLMLYRYAGDNAGTGINPTLRDQMLAATSCADTRISSPSTNSHYIQLFFVEPCLDLTLAGPWPCIALSRSAH